MTLHSRNGGLLFLLNTMFKFVFLLSLGGRTSNNAKFEAKKAFLQFDLNSQPNGRRLYFRNPTHYLLPCFNSIPEPKRSALNYEEKNLCLASSIIYKLNKEKTLYHTLQLVETGMA